MPVDKRTDVWAFGCVLYETLTGRQAFIGETSSDLIAGIIEREPDWSRLPGNLSPALQRLLRRCLEKDSQQRLRDIGDARLEIQAEIQHTRSGTATVAGRGITTRSDRLRRWLPVAGVTDDRRRRGRSDCRPVHDGSRAIYPACRAFHGAVAAQLPPGLD